jgi:transcriptional regulator with GAF, ATPase, and Fis domain
MAGVNRSVDLIGSSIVFKQLLERVRLLATCDENTLISGELGTGKTEIARLLHQLSPRRSNSLIYFDCGQLSESLAEGELFGYQKGSFTGAVRDRTGLFEAANRGTLVMDEIANLSMTLQAKFLRVIQDKKIRRLGENSEIDLDLRFIAATYRDLNVEVEKGSFRGDLFSRLDVLNIEVPPIRERGDDVLELASYRIFRLNEKYGKKKVMDKSVTSCLMKYRWPENVRELNNAVTKSYFNSKCDVISIEDFPHEVRIGKKGLGDKYSCYKNQIEYLYTQIIRGDKTFWGDVSREFLDRNFNRQQLSDLIKFGLIQNDGKYINLCRTLGCDYNRFMGFLRHHKLKPRAEDIFRVFVPEPSDNNSLDMVMPG